MLPMSTSSVLSSSRSVDLITTPRSYHLPRSLDIFTLRKLYSLRRIRNYRRQAFAGWKISAADGDIALQLSAGDCGQTVALKPHRSRNLVPRVWSRPAYHYDARQVWALCRHPRSDRSLRGSLAYDAKRGLG